MTRALPALVLVAVTSAIFFSGCRQCDEFYSCIDCDCCPWPPGWDCGGCTGGCDPEKRLLSCEACCESKTCTDPPSWWDAGTDADVIEDATTDMDMDTGDCRPLTPTGECSIMDQCGCPDGFHCWLFEDGGYCRFKEICVHDFTFETPIHVGDECPLGYTCEWRGACWPRAEEPRYCHAYCLSDDDSSHEGARCEIDLSYPTRYCGDVLAPVSLCTLP